MGRVSKAAGRELLRNTRPGGHWVAGRQGRGREVGVRTVVLLAGFSDALGTCYDRHEEVRVTPR